MARKCEWACAYVWQGPTAPETGSLRANSACFLYSSDVWQGWGSLGNDVVITSHHASLQAGAVKTARYVISLSLIGCLWRLALCRSLWSVLTVETLPDPLETSSTKLRFHHGIVSNVTMKPCLPFQVFTDGKYGCRKIAKLLKTYRINNLNEKKVIIY